MANLPAKADLIDSSKSAAAMMLLIGDLHDFLEGHLGALEDLTISPATPVDNTAKALELLGGLAYQIQQITGKVNWYDATPAPMSPYMSGYKNKLINGIPLYMQRGASVVIAAGASAYAWDRWYVTNGTNQSITCTLTAYNSWAKSFRVAPTGTAPTTGNVTVQQKIEGAQTLSIQDRGDGNSTLYVEVDGYDPTASIVQFFGTGGSPSASVETAFTLAKTNLGGTVNKFVGSVAVPSVGPKTPGTDAGTNYLSLKYVIPLRTANCDILVNQLEPGTVDTPFESRHIAQELALCQRYYEFSNDDNHSFLTTAGSGSTVCLYFKVTKRAVPTMNIVNHANAVGAASQIVTNSVNGSVITNGAGVGNKVAIDSWIADAEL